MFELDRLCFEPAFRFTRSAMRRFAEAPNAIVRLACQPFDEPVPEHEPVPERLLGFAILHFEEAEEGLAGYVVTLDVAAEVRRQGVAGALMASLDESAAEAGARAMELHVSAGNAGALRLYERLGYHHAHTVANFYGRGLNALVCRKALLSARSLDRENPQGYLASEE